MEATNPSGFYFCELETKYRSKLGSIENKTWNLLPTSRTDSFHCPISRVNDSLTILVTTRLRRWFALVPQWNSERPTILPCGPGEPAREHVRLLRAPPHALCFVLQVLQFRDDAPGSVCAFLSCALIKRLVNGVFSTKARVEPRGWALCPGVLA